MWAKRIISGAFNWKLIAFLFWLWVSVYLPVFASEQKGFETDPYRYSQSAANDEQLLIKNLQKHSQNIKNAPDAVGQQSPADNKRLNFSQGEPPVDPKIERDESTAFSRLIRQEITTMPDGGSYGVSAHAVQQFKKSVTLNEKGCLEIEANDAKPSFCSSATYLAFLSGLASLEDMGSIPSEKPVNLKLLVHNESDGTGVWGRWNANGPGTALLVKELGIGENFLDLKKAVPGDFLKVWWTKEIGGKEHGHSVVYLGTRTDAAGDSYLKFWSSNIPGGYGVKEVPMTRVKGLLFSRITNPKEIKNVLHLNPTNEFLASMTTRTVTMDDVKKELGIR